MGRISPSPSHTSKYSAGALVVVVLAIAVMVATAEWCFTGSCDNVVSVFVLSATAGAIIWYAFEMRGYRMEEREGNRIRSKSWFYVDKACWDGEDKNRPPKSLAIRIVNCGPTPAMELDVNYELFLQHTDESSTIVSSGVHHIGVLPTSNEKLRVLVSDVAQEACRIAPLPSGNIRDVRLSLEIKATWKQYDGANQEYWAKFKSPQGSKETWIRQDDKY